MENVQYLLNWGRFKMVKAKSTSAYDDKPLDTYLTCKFI